MRRLEVVEYDGEWPSLFEQEVALLSPVFGNDLVSIHHVGSTAVPGLAAKPTIDILCEIRAGAVITDYYEAMSGLGYECRGECLDAVVPGTPGRFYFPKVIDHQHVVHVHVCHEGHAQITEILAFRDYLVAHPSEVRQYGALKAKLAEQFEHDNVEYMRGKDSFVRSLIEKAGRWRSGIAK